MVVIVIEDSVYKVTEREYKKLSKMQDELKELDDREKMSKEVDLMEYIESQKKSYKLIGPIMFDCRH